MTNQMAGGRWAQPNGSSELDCPWCARDPLSSDTDDADCTCVQWCGSPDCTAKAPDPDTAALIGAFEAVQAERDELRDLLDSIWLYVSWRYVTKRLTTKQRELWANAADAFCRKGQIDDGEEPHPVAERWWRDDFVEGA